MGVSKKKKKQVRVEKNELRNSDGHGIGSAYVLVMITAEDLEYLKKGQEQILQKLEWLHWPGRQEVSGKMTRASYVTAQQFMDAVHIRRWKFNQLIAANKIKTVKKKRKIYVPEAEIERFFSDPFIQ